jgi:hypothetical protein
LRVVTPAPRDIWREIVASDPTAFVYQTPEGIDAICAARGEEDASRLYEFPDGRRLVLPLHRKRGRPAWMSVETSPLIGSLVSPGPVRPDELRSVLEDLARHEAFQVRIVPGALHGEEWEAVVPQHVQRLPKRAHVVDLQDGFEKVWKDRFNGQGRRGVRKAEKVGLEVECGRGSALLPELYDLYRLSVDRWARRGRQPTFLARWRADRSASLEELQARMAALGDACRIWMARVDGRAAAAIIVLQGANAHYTMGAMDKELAGPTRANFLLHKLAIEDACREGCRYYNMGETGTSSSLARFKAHFGATEYSYFEYRLERIPVTALERRLKSWAKRLLRRGSGSAEESS